MKDPGEPQPPSTSSVPAALLDYFEAPGKYQLTLRQPAVLFSSVREILQLASDRSAADAPQSGELREAANFFIRAALLYPGGDHYAVLGLAPGENATDLKERYRLLMRLIHPDFAGTAGMAWPADAAVRVNRAYEVLSSPVLRREYDEQLAALRNQRPASAKPPAFAAPAVRRQEEPHGRFRKKTALLFGLAVGVPAILLLMPRSEPDHLVQRLPARRAAQQPGPAQADARDPAPVALADAAPVPRSEPSAGPASSLENAPAALPEPPRAVPVAPANVASAGKPVPQEPAATAPRSAAVANVAGGALPPQPVAPVARATPAPAPAPARTVEAPPAPVPPPLPAIVLAPPGVAEPAGHVPIPAAAPASAGPVLAALSPVPAATATPSALPASKVTVTLLPAMPTPTLADAQPVLTQVLQVLESGSGDQLLRLLDGDARRQPAAQALSRQYEQLVRGGRPVHVGQVDFKGEPREGGVLLVTGQIRLHTGEPTIGSFGQKLVVRAEFAQREGKVQLTGLSGVPE